MTEPRRVSRGSVARPQQGRERPVQRRRSPQSHDRVKGRARPGRQHRRNEVAEDPNRGNRFLRGATKALAKLVLALVIFSVFVFGVFPTGSYFQQRSELRDAEEDLAEIQQENSLLEARIARLGSDSEIEVEAREFGLVRPEEENYLIIAPGE